MGRPRLLASLALVVVTLFAHGSSLSGGFVYDDHRFIEHNKSIRSVPIVSAFSDPTTASHEEGIQADIYRPLRTILFSLEYQLFAREGADGTIDFHPRWWHLLSVLLHALNAVLVLRVLLPLLRGALLPAALGAAVFAVHPITSESVSWLSSQGDLLAMTFLLWGLIVMERPGVRRTVGGAALFLVACLSKESALVLPLLLPLRDVALPRGAGALPRGAGALPRGAGALPGGDGAAVWSRTTWVRTGTLAGVACLYFALRYAVLPGLRQVEHADGSVLATARGMLHGLGWYAESLLLPLGFTFDTRIDVPLRWTDPEVIVGLGILGSLIAAGVYGLVRKRYLLAFAALGLLVTLGPVSNVIVPLKTFVADRFLYPGLLCVAAGVAAFLSTLRGTPRSALLTITVAVVVALGVLTSGRGSAWASEMSLWEKVRQDRPWNANAYQGIAYEYLAQKRVVDAENAFATYLEANPYDGKAMFAMGNLFGELAGSLVHVGRPGPAGDTNMELRNKQARLAQIRLYQRAFGVWSVPGGLQLGRGSKPMLLAMLDSWINAGMDFGSLQAAKFANDEAIGIEANGAYGPADLEAVWSKASIQRRAVRIQMALQALRAKTNRNMAADLKRRILASRSAVLLDVGLDPSLSQMALARPLAEKLQALVDESLRTPGGRPEAQSFADLASLYDGAGDLEMAKRALRQGLKAWPGEPTLGRYLGGMEARDR